MPSVKPFGKIKKTISYSDRKKQRMGKVLEDRC